MSTTFWETVSTSPAVRTAWQVPKSARGTPLPNRHPDDARMNGRGSGETVLEGNRAILVIKDKRSKKHWSNCRASEKRGPVRSRVLRKFLAACGTSGCDQQERRRTETGCTETGDQVDAQGESTLGIKK